MKCYRNGGCGPYEMYSCYECPASKPEYIERDENKGCVYCSGDYHQEITATVYRFHTSSEMTQKTIAVKYCPNCGRKLS